MSDIRTLIDQFAHDEARFREQTLLAPSLRNGMVRTRLNGIVYEFASEPSTFEGWGLFRPSSAKSAEFLEEPPLYMVEKYLALFPLLRVRLIQELQSASWLAYPVNESDMRQRFGSVRPLPIHLVFQGKQFDQVLGRWDGDGLWFQELDRKADPIRSEEMRESLTKGKKRIESQRSGLTPEEKTSYSIALKATKAYQAEQRRRYGETKVRTVLRRAGGDLQSLQDRQSFWLVEWSTSDGEHHTSAITKDDMTVVGAGICLDGHDREFDLQSLVPVIENRPEWMR